MHITKNISLYLILSFLLIHSAFAQLNLDSTSLQITTIAEDLEVPWEILWGPDDHIWFTERPGKVNRVNPETKMVEPLLTIDEVVTVSESGLLGMALHPNFTHPDSSFVYLVYTYLKESELTEKVVRYTYESNSLVDPEILLDDIPANNNHDGSRLLISPDRKLFVTTGDAQNTSLAQNTNSLAGKILRLNLDGTIPDDNPISNSYIWSIGHRNPQGLVRSPKGILYSSEHGPSNDDELNIIVKNGHYGWPDVQGYCGSVAETNFCSANNVTEPISAWTPTLAVAGIDYYDHPAIPEWRNSILLVTLKEDDFRVIRLNEDGDEVIDEKVYLNNEYGRLRDICISPAGDIYISTSNRDGRANDGFPIAEDDRIIKLSNDNKMITGISDQVSKNSVVLYPNPVKNWLNTDFDNAMRITIFDYSSGMINEGEYKNRLDVSNLKSGIYFMEVLLNDGKRNMIKFMKE